MHISIVTVCRNSELTIRETIESVAAQNLHIGVEYIVIDGGSTDGTMSIVDEYRNEIDRIVSEPDDGIYDAMNKGIAAASGDVIGILNSDDTYASAETLQRVVARFEDTAVESVYGDVVYVDRAHGSRIVRYWRAGEFLPGSFKYGWHPPHPAFFLRSKCYAAYGSFNTELSVSADFELMLRMLERYRVRASYIHQPLVKMRAGGTSTGSIKNVLVGNRNCYRAFKLNDLPVGPLYPARRLLGKVGQLLVSKSARK